MLDFTPYKPTRRGFGAVTTETGTYDTGNGQLDRALANVDALQASLLAVRAALVQTGVALNAGGQYLPADAVDQYAMNRSKAAQAVEVLVTGIIENVRAIPFIGESRAQKLGSAQDWADGFLNRVPLLPADIIDPSQRSSSMPALTPDEASSFGVLPAAAFIALGVGISVLLAGIGVYILSSGVAKAFNQTAQNLSAQNEVLGTWSQGVTARLQAAKAAGASQAVLDQIATQTTPPPPSSSGVSFGTFASIAVGLLLVGGVIYYAKNRKR